jgi:hypothetical protein
MVRCVPQRRIHCFKPIAPGVRSGGRLQQVVNDVKSISICLHMQLSESGIDLRTMADF